MGNVRITMLKKQNVSRDVRGLSSWKAAMMTTVLIVEWRCWRRRIGKTVALTAREMLPRY